MLSQDIANRGSEAFAGTFVFGFTIFGGIFLILLGVLIGYIYGKNKGGKK
ncbi:MAG: hypothetical protein AABX54_00690 [Nanoarchaeota archaeon]